MAQLVVALDMDRAESALHLAENLRDTVTWFKVGLELFTSAGPELARRLKAGGCKVFLDLKFYDIPNTVRKAVLAAIDLGVDMLTLHCQGGERMCLAAREAAKGTDTLLFGVTALTSFATGEMPGIDLDPGLFGRNLAARALAWQLDGVVCSGHEAAQIKKTSPGLLCLCPGIRMDSRNKDDQRRTMTPEMAVAAGADFLVVGRPILEAQNPLAAAREILRRMRQAEK